MHTQFSEPLKTPKATFSYHAQIDSLGKESNVSIEMTFATAAIAKQYYDQLSTGLKNFLKIKDNVLTIPPSTAENLFASGAYVGADSSKLAIKFTEETLRTEFIQFLDKCCPQPASTSATSPTLPYRADSDAGTNKLFIEKALCYKPPALPIRIPSFSRETPPGLFEDAQHNMHYLIGFNNGEIAIDNTCRTLVSLKNLFGMTHTNDDGFDLSLNAERAIQKKQEVLRLELSELLQSSNKDVQQRAAKKQKQLVQLNDIRTILQNINTPQLRTQMTSGRGAFPKPIQNMLVLNNQKKPNCVAIQLSPLHFDNYLFSKTPLFSLYRASKPNIGGTNDLHEPKYANGFAVTLRNGLNLQTIQAYPPANIINSIMNTILEKYKKYKPTVTNLSDNACETEADFKELNKCIQVTLSEYNINLSTFAVKELDARCCFKYFDDNLYDIPISITDIWEYLNAPKTGGITSGLAEALSDLENSISPFYRKRTTMEATTNDAFCMAIQGALAAMNVYYYQKHKDPLNFGMAIENNSIGSLLSKKALKDVLIERIRNGITQKKDLEEVLVNFLNEYIIPSDKAFQTADVPEIKKFVVGSFNSVTAQAHLDEFYFYQDDPSSSFYLYQNKQCVTLADFVKNDPAHTALHQQYYASGRLSETIRTPGIQDSHRLKEKEETPTQSSTTVNTNSSSSSTATLSASSNYIELDFNEIKNWSVEKLALVLISDNLEAPGHSIFEFSKMKDTEKANKMLKQLKAYPQLSALTTAVLERLPKSQGKKFTTELSLLPVYTMTLSFKAEKSIYVAYGMNPKADLAKLMKLPREERIKKALTELAYANADTIAKINISSVTGELMIYFKNEQAVVSTEETVEAQVTLNSQRTHVFTQMGVSLYQEAEAKMLPEEKSRFNNKSLTHNQGFSSSQASKITVTLKTLFPELTVVSATDVKEWDHPAKKSMPVTFQDADGITKPFDLNTMMYVTFQESNGHLVYGSLDNLQRLSEIHYRRSTREFSYDQAKCILSAATQIKTSDAVAPTFETLDTQSLEKALTLLGIQYYQIQLSANGWRLSCEEYAKNQVEDFASKNEPLAGIAEPNFTATPESVIQDMALATTLCSTIEAYLFNYEQKKEGFLTPGASIEYLDKQIQTAATLKKIEVFTPDNEIIEQWKVLDTRLNTYLAELKTAANAYDYRKGTYACFMEREAVILSSQHILKERTKSNQAKEEINALVNELTKIKTELESIDQTLTKTHQNIVDQLALASSSENPIAAYKAISALVEEHKKMVSQSSQMMTDCKKKFDQLKNARDTYEDSAVAINAHCQVYKKTFDDGFATGKKLIADLEQGMAKMAGGINLEQQKEVKALAERNQVLSQNATKLEQEKQQLSEANTVLKDKAAKYTALEAEHKNTQSALTEAQKQQKNLVTELKGATEQNDANQEKVLALSEANMKQEEQIKMLVQSDQENKITITTLSQQVEENKKTITALAQENESHKNANTSLTQENENNKTVLETLKKEQEELKKENEQLRTEQTILKTIASTAQTTLATTQASLKKQTEELVAIQETLETKTIATLQQKTPDAGTDISQQSKVTSTSSLSKTLLLDDIEEDLIDSEKQMEKESLTKIAPSSSASKTSTALKVSTETIITLTGLSDALKLRLISTFKKMSSDVKDAQSEKLQLLSSMRQCLGKSIFLFNRYLQAYAGQREEGSNIKIGFFSKHVRHTDKGVKNAEELMRKWSKAQKNPDAANPSAFFDELVLEYFEGCESGKFSARIQKILGTPPQFERILVCALKAVRQDALMAAVGYEGDLNGHSAKSYLLAYLTDMDNMIVELSGKVPRAQGSADHGAYVESNDGSDSEQNISENDADFSTNLSSFLQDFDTNYNPVTTINSDTHAKETNADRRAQLQEYEQEVQEYEQKRSHEPPFRGNES